MLPRDILGRVLLMIAACLLLALVLGGCAWNGGRVVVVLGIGNNTARGDLDDEGATVDVTGPEHQRERPGPRMPSFGAR